MTRHVPEARCLSRLRRQVHDGVEDQVREAKGPRDPTVAKSPMVTPSGRLPAWPAVVRPPLGTNRCRGPPRRGPRAAPRSGPCRCPARERVRSGELGKQVDHRPHRGRVDILSALSSYVPATASPKKPSSCTAQIYRTVASTQRSVTMPNGQIWKASSKPSPPPRLSRTSPSLPTTLPHGSATTAWPSIRHAPKPAGQTTRTGLA